MTRHELGKGWTALTPSQQEWYQARFGVRYVQVQEQPQRPSRRVRRSRRKADLG